MTRTVLICTFAGTFVAVGGDASAKPFNLGKAVTSVTHRVADKVIDHVDPHASADERRVAKEGLNMAVNPSQAETQKSMNNIRRTASGMAGGSSASHHSPSRRGPNRSFRGSFRRWQRAAAAGEWWCVCYSAREDGIVMANTACRRSLSVCQALERVARRGLRSFIRGSVTHACRRYNVAHPGEAMGGRGLWLPSSRPGAWWSKGQCLMR